MVEQNNNDMDKKKKTVICPNRVYEEISVAVPIEVQAYADVKDIVLKCKGHRIIKEVDRRRHRCKLTIVQEVSLAIPIDCITEVEVKHEQVDYDIHDGHDDE